MKLQERKHRLALTLLFSGVVFCFFIITISVVGLVTIFLIQRGIIGLNSGVLKSERLILLMMLASVLLGAVLTTIISSFP